MPAKCTVESLTGSVLTRSLGGGGGSPSPKASPERALGGPSPKLFRREAQSPTLDIVHVSGTHIPGSGILFQSLLVHSVPSGSRRRERELWGLERGALLGAGPGRGGCWVCPHRRPPAHGKGKGL